MTFVQTISFTTSNIEEIQKMSEEYRREQGDRAPGFRRNWVMKDRDNPNHYLISVEFDSYEKAMENSARPETDAFAKKMRELIDGEPEYGNYDLISEE